MRLWGIIRKNHKIAAQRIVDLASAQMPDVTDALDRLAHDLDLSRPIVLPKHEQEIAAYGRTYFLPRDFIDPVSLDRFEVEILFDEHAQKKRSRDPRNDFSTY